MIERDASVIDGMTGLSNKRGFMVLAEQAVRVASRSKKSFWVIVLDVDGIKRTNNDHGHAAGDRLIFNAALALRKTFRACDIVARTGGDEFTVLALDSGAPDIEALKERLSEGLAEFNRFATPKISFSSGWALFDAKFMPPLEAILARADKAMRDEKEARRS